MAHSKRISHHLDATLQSLLVFFRDFFIVEKSLIVKFKIKYLQKNVIIILPLASHEYPICQGNLLD